MPKLLTDFLQECQVRTNTALSKHLPNPDEFTASRTLMAAMRYSTVNGGKRLRPVLVYAAASAVNTDSTIAPPLADDLDTIACALECIHAYSLIHDDLPAMDDDDLRRGQPTCHIAFDEATAILAGDALQSQAYECLSQLQSLPAATVITLMRTLAHASGALGMVGGQAIDLASVNQQLNLQQLELMHRHKTGALIKASVIMGAIATGMTNDHQLTALTTYADAIGLAFQVQDDILDVTADTATLGKRQGADIALNKPTYVSLLGLEGAQLKANELCLQATSALSDFGPGADHLRQIATYIIERQH